MGLVLLDVGAARGRWISGVAMVSLMLYRLE